MRENYTSAPINVTLKLTNACNLNCLHCHSQSGESKVNMSKEMALRIIDQLREQKVFGINISGGEPLLYPHFFEIVEYMNKAGIRVTVSTNAVLVTEEIAEKMAEHRIKGVQISLDGCNEEIHDRIRNVKGCYKKTLEGIELLKKYNIPVMLVTVISNQTLEEYSDIIDFAYKIGAKAHKTNAMLPIGNAKENMDLLEDKFLTKYIEIWLKKKNEYKGKMEIKGEMGFLMQVGLEQYHSEKNPTILNIGCPAGITTCAILENGDVVPCSFCGDVICGNINENEFKDIWENSEIFKKIRERDFEDCNKCKHIKYCGGCRVRALYNGNLYGKDPFCWKMKE